MSYEVNLQVSRIQTQDKKSIAFQAEKEDSYSEDDMAFIAKNFKKFLKFKKSNKFGNNKNSSKPSSSVLKCYECHKKGHMKKDCPDRKKDKFSFKKDIFKKKQAFSVT